MPRAGAKLDIQAVGLSHATLGVHRKMIPGTLGNCPLSSFPHLPSTVGSDQQRSRHGVQSAEACSISHLPPALRSQAATSLPPRENGEHRCLAPKAPWSWLTALSCGITGSQSEIVPLGGWQACSAPRLEALHSCGLTTQPSHGQRTGPELASVLPSNHC